MNGMELKMCLCEKVPKLIDRLDNCSADECLSIVQALEVILGIMESSTDEFDSIYSWLNRIKIADARKAERTKRKDKAVRETFTELAKTLDDLDKQ